MILHLKYHHNDTPHKIVCDLWSGDFVEYLAKDIEGGRLRIKQTILAHSRP